MSSDNSDESLETVFEHVTTMAGLDREVLSESDVVYRGDGEKVVLKDWDGYEYCLVEYHIDGERVEDLPCDTVADVKSEAEEFVSVMQDEYKE